MGLFRPLNRGLTLAFSASWALGPKAHCGQARPGLGHPHRHEGEWDTHPSALRDKSIPLWERRTEGRWANSARISPQAEPEDRLSPAQLPKDLRHPSLDPARLRVQVHNSAIQTPQPLVRTQGRLRNKCRCHKPPAANGGWGWGQASPFRVWGQGAWVPSHSRAAGLDPQSLGPK